MDWADRIQDELLSRTDQRWIGFYVGFFCLFFYDSQLEGWRKLKALQFSEAINLRLSSNVENMQLKQEYVMYHG